MATYLITAWGGKDWTGPLWPSHRAPMWAQIAARRMISMGLSEKRINEVLKEMRATRVHVTYDIGDRQYDVVVE